MELNECDLCSERVYGTGPVPGEGNKQLARICLLGRNPGTVEDQQKRPFVGPAGRKLNQGLILAGLLRNECYITNLVKCMTPKDVSPSVPCIQHCTHTWLVDELQGLEKLELLIVFGNQALQCFEPLGRVGMLHGTVFKTLFPGDTKDYRLIKIFVSYHPSAALRSITINTQFLDDMRKLKGLLSEPKTS